MVPTQPVLAVHVDLFLVAISMSRDYRAAPDQRKVDERRAPSLPQTPHIHFLRHLLAWFPLRQPGMTGTSKVTFTWREKLI